MPLNTLVKGKWGNKGIHKACWNRTGITNKPLDCATAIENCRGRSGCQMTGFSGFFVEVHMYKETVLQNITATDELLKVGNGLQHQRLLSLPLPSIQGATYVYTQFARTKQVGKTEDWWSPVNFNATEYEKDGCGIWWVFLVRMLYCLWPTVTQDALTAATFERAK